jgi:hypothetical protein
MNISKIKMVFLFVFVSLLTSNLFSQDTKKTDLLIFLEDIFKMKEQAAIAKLTKDGYKEIDKISNCTTYGTCSDKSNCSSTIQLCYWGICYNTFSALDLIRCELDLKKYQTQNDPERDTRVYETNGVRYSFLPGYIDGYKTYALYIKKLD